MRYKGLDSRLEDPEYRRLYQEEKLILDVTELICEAMEETGTSRSVLAQLLHRTKGYVTHLLTGRRNMTLRTWADIMTALGYQARVFCEPLDSTGAVQFTVSTRAENEPAARWASTQAAGLGQPRVATGQDNHLAA